MLFSRKRFPVHPTAAERSSNMLNPKIISENIIFLRQQQNMTQQELAARVNVTHQAVSK